MTTLSDEVLDALGRILDGDCPFILAYKDPDTNIVWMYENGDHLIQAGLLNYLTDHINNPQLPDEDEDG
ncbi:MAG TPA: hypothetical protein PK916_08985 [Bacteroidota bacterium]|nr:hypothetical protein [Bacteroidota bacterium]